MVDNSEKVKLGMQLTYASGFCMYHMNNDFPEAFDITVWADGIRSEFIGETEGYVDEMLKDMQAKRELTDEEINNVKNEWPLYLQQGILALYDCECEAEDTESIIKTLTGNETLNDFVSDLSRLCETTYEGFMNQTGYHRNILTPEILIQSVQKAKEDGILSQEKPINEWLPEVVMELTGQDISPSGPPVPPVLQDVEQPVDDYEQPLDELDQSGGP